MKNLLFLLCCLVCSASRADHQSYQKLAEVNQCWTEQKDIPALPEYTNRSEKEWIRLHLGLVEQTLRARELPQLSTEQKANRAHCLDILHRYWQEGNFPINDRYASRTPIFIDPYNNFCAVGFLLKETGFEAVSRKISAQTNLAYVRQMQYPELTAWAGSYGFSVDELAWIQPAYPPQSSVRRLGAGVDGMVQELYVDDAAEKMYVGGSFVQADGSVTANNIAYVTEASGVYTWHNMGTGVHGKVNAITKFDDKIFAAGSFDEVAGKMAANVAYWDGSEWTAAGCINGTIHDLLVFEGKLYACGSFADCSGGSESNFAQWNGSDWTMIPGLKGRINTMEVNGASIVLGGAFSYGPVTNVVQWNTSSSFTPFLNGISNEVMDFELHEATVYAACKRAGEADTNAILLRLIAGTWEQGFASPYEAKSFDAKGSGAAFLTLCTEGTTLNIGGAFSYISMTYGANCYNMGGGSRKWSVVDNTVNKMVLFKGEVYFGGLFQNGSEYSEATGEGTVTGLNGIAKRAEAPLSVPKVDIGLAKELRVIPNPAKGNSFVSVENNINADRYTLYELCGKILETGQLGANGTLRVPSVAAGVYFLNLGNAGGQMLHSKIIVQ
ncbi:MAG: T9SS type A sorting domain-containing protein [Chitinophagaceae bacterium]|nr:T9SS type A sorting domain-containing protein [Chitinophagaceae bacterium]